jgi:hypothetical protein
MHRQELERMTQAELTGHAERLGIADPQAHTQAELIEEIVARTTPVAGETGDTGEVAREKAPGLLGRARDLVARALERGLHLPGAARALGWRPQSVQWPAPPPPLPTLTLAEIYASQGHVDRAVAVLEEVLAREPGSADAMALRARLIQQPAERPELAGLRGKGIAGATPSPEVARVAGRPLTAGAPPKGSREPRKQGAAAGTRVSAPGIEVSNMSDASEAADANSGSVDSAGGEEPQSKAAAPTETREPERTVPMDGATSARAEPTAGESAGGAGDDDRLQAAERIGNEARQGVERPAEASKSEAATAAMFGHDRGAQTESEGDAKAPAREEAEDDDLALDDTTLPERYEVDEIVAISVDPRTIYVYWEVRADSFARASSEHPDGALAIRVASVITGWEGPRVETQDLRVDALYGDRFVREIQPGSTIRVSVGWKSALGFEPFAVGAEVTAPRITPVKETSVEVARWQPAPPAAPRIEPPSPGPSPEPPAAPHAAAPTSPAAAPPPPAFDVVSCRVPYVPGLVPPLLAVEPFDFPAEGTGFDITFPTAVPPWALQALPLPVRAPPFHFSRAPETAAAVGEVFEEVCGPQEYEGGVPEGGRYPPGGSSELGRSGPSRTPARRILRSSARPAFHPPSPILPGFPRPAAPIAAEWVPPLVGGASDLSRPPAPEGAFGAARDAGLPQASDWTPGGASELWRTR